MKRTILLTTVLAIGITISMIMTAQAEAFRGGKRGHGPHAAGLGGMRALMELDLSQGQKQTIYDILQKYEDDQLAARAVLKAHKQELFDMTAAGAFNEDKFRQAFQESVPAMEDAFILRARVKSEIMAVLSEDQLEELQERRAEHAARKQGRDHEFRRAMLETWLTMDNE